MALKILYNYGIASGHVADEFRREHDVLVNRIPPHENIIAVLGVIEAERLTREIVDALPDVARELARRVDARSGAVTYARTTALVMDLLPTTLEQYVRDLGDDLPAAQCVRLGQQVVAGLLHLHRHGIVHADMKLNNILVDPASLHVLIIDFGMCISAERRGPGAEFQWGLRVGGGNIFGNPNHRSPEVCRALRVYLRDGAAEVDISMQPSFAAGVVL